MLGRSASTLAALCLLLAAVVGSAGAAPVGGSSVSVSDVAALAQDVLVQVNDVRREHGLGPLQLDTALSAAAAQHAREMAQDGYFSHDSADGSAFWKRVTRYYPSAHYRFWAVGENLLWASPDVDGPDAVTMWMNSPEHRANLLSPRWRQIGLSAVHALAAPGAFQGLDVTIVAADFGVRH
jgi:uncharacterized protein YkwD